MQSHTEDFSEVDYVAFKDNLESRVQGIKDFKQVADKVGPQLAQQVESKLGESLEKLRQANPGFSQQYDNETLKPLTDAECAKRWDICEISASLLCCVPSYILTLCHVTNRNYDLCNCCCSGSKECGDKCYPNDICSNSWDNRNCAAIAPGLNFFCRPLGNIIDKCEDYKKQNQIIEEIQARAPDWQRMA